MSIVVFQHGPGCGPGRLGMTFRDHGFFVDARRLYIPREAGGMGVPPDFDGVQGVVSLGGEPNVGDKLPWMAEEMAFLREAHARELPVIGVCLGAQLIATALGGQVGAMERPELGFARVLLNPAGQTETIFAGIPWDSPQLSSHQQEVRLLPPGATLLATSRQCKVEAYRVGIRTYAFQYHFECDRPMLDEYLKGAGAGLLERAGTTSGELLVQADQLYPSYARLADRLCVNLVTFAFPTKKKLSA